MLTLTVTAFASAQEAVNYINANARVIGLDGGTDMTGEDINFRLDATSTSILSTTGSQWGEPVKAVLSTNGLISIHSIGEGIPTGSEAVNERKHYRNIEPACKHQWYFAPGGPQDVVNAMNELFTVGAFTQVVISPARHSTMIADVSDTVTTTTLINNGFDPVGDDVYATSQNNANTNGFKTTESIDKLVNTSRLTFITSHLRLWFGAHGRKLRSRLLQR